MDSRNPLLNLYEAENKSQMPYHYTTGTRRLAARSRACDHIRVLPFPLPFPRAGCRCIFRRQERQRGARRVWHAAARRRSRRRVYAACSNPEPHSAQRAQRPGRLAASVRPARGAPGRAHHPAGRAASTSTPTSSISISPRWRTSARPSPACPKGLGPGRGRAELERMEQLDLSRRRRDAWRGGARCAPVRRRPGPEATPVERVDRPVPNAHRIQERRRAGRAARISRSSSAVCATASAPCARCTAPGRWTIDFRAHGRTRRTPSA